MDDQGTYKGLEIYSYPQYEANPPGKYNDKAAFHSKYLKANTSFPVLSPDPVLQSLGQVLGNMIAKLHTSITLSPRELDKVWLAPDSGTIEEGVNWLKPYVDEYNLVSFDTENEDANKRPAYCILGALSGHVLIVDVRQAQMERLPPPLRPLIEGRLVLGSGLGNDTGMLRGLVFRTGEIQTLSLRLQSHSKFPYHAGTYLGRRKNLKFIPMLIYGEYYGPLHRRDPRNTKFLEVCKPGFKRPWWLQPPGFYRYGRGKPKREQIAYMKNDGVAPHIHVLLLTMLEAANGGINPQQAEVSQAIKSVLERRYGTVPHESAAPSGSASSGRLGTPSGGASPGEGGSLKGWGLPSGLPDHELRKRLAELDDDTRKDITLYDYLDPFKPEDRAFIDHHGGLITLKRAATMLETDDNLTPPSKPTDTALAAVGSDDAQMLEEAERMFGVEPNKTPAGGDPPGSNTMRQERDQTPGVGEKRPLMTSPARDHDERHQHSAECKRRRMEVEVWDCPGEATMVAVIPVVNPMTLAEMPAGPVGASRGFTDAERKAAMDEGVTARCPPRSRSSSTSSDDSSASSSSTSSTDDTTDEAVTMAPEEVPEEERLELLRGRVDRVNLPSDVVLPPRFTAVPSFTNKCNTCGHKFNSKYRSIEAERKRHPEEPCPGLRRYGQEHFDAATQTWNTKPCGYPLCPWPTNHLSSVCKQLHALCHKCGERGHDLERCDVVHVDFTRRERETAYQEYKAVGLKTRKANPDWDFIPKLKPFRLLHHGTQSYLFPWDESKMQEYHQAEDQKRSAMIREELGQ